MFGVREAFRKIGESVRELQQENEQLKAENAKLWELGEQYEVVAADYRSEIVKLRELCGEMFKEHQRIYHTGGVLRSGPSATSEQMANWYSECIRWGIEVDE